MAAKRLVWLFYVAVDYDYNKVIKHIIIIIYTPGSKETRG